MSLPSLKKFAVLILDFFFPKFCLGCGREGELICSPCHNSLPRLQPPLCPQCGLPLSLEPCPYCKGKRLALDGIRSPFRYEGLIREAIHNFKYQNLRALAPTLAWLLKEYLDFHPLPIEVIVPVPLHPKKLRERGYNQSGLLAKQLGLFLGLPVIENSLKRKRNTPPQTKIISRDERWRNVSDAFVCNGGDVKGRNVLLIDDVCTTGATLDACAQALKSAGAISVWGLTLARET